MERFAASVRVGLGVVLAAILISVVGPTPATGNSAGTGLVISQVYGGGGNSGAPYTNDYVELFNPTAVPISLAGYSVQYASATGTGSFSANAVTALSGALAPGQYYLVQQASGGANGVPLPTPDATGSVNMSATGGKVILASTTTGLACNGGSTPCSVAQLAQIVDLVGYDGANFYEGTAPAPTLSNTTAAFRAGAGCTDTDDNGADFNAAAPNPRNIASPLHPCADSLVVSQVYGGGGNTGAPYTNDYVELFNPTLTPISLAGYSVQYASATGTGNFAANPVTALSGTLAPGQYYLVQQASGGANGVALPTPDATGTANLAAGGGKVILVNTTTGLACNGGSTPCSAAQLAQIIDLVGYDGANFYEGAAPAPTLSNTTAAFRAGAGCTDTDDNGADFTAAAPNPRNTASPLHFCTTAIHAIQGAGHISPFAGQTVVTTGIVTAKTTNGFWMQDPSPDADDATSEGIFVFTSVAPAVAVGDAVQVAGTAQEFRPGGTSSANLTTTELTSPTIAVLSSGNALPAPDARRAPAGGSPPDTVIEDDATGDVETSGVFDPASDGLDFWESLEGMRVELNNAVAVGPTNLFGQTAVVGDDGANASVRTARGGLVDPADRLQPGARPARRPAHPRPARRQRRRPLHERGHRRPRLQLRQLRPRGDARCRRSCRRGRPRRRPPCRPPTSSPSRPSTSRTSPRATRRRSSTGSRT